MTAPAFQIPTEAYPLAWPARAPRTPEAQRKRSTFKNIDFETTQYGRRQIRRDLSVGAEVARVRDEVRRIKGAEGLVISTNLPVRGDGLPRADGRVKGGDPGVAVYWAVRASKYRVIPYVMPCDTYDDVADNLHAVALSIEAMRSLDRWGAVKLEQAFAGFQALPPGSDGAHERPWREVLGGYWPEGEGELEPEEILALAKKRHRAKLEQVHPDKGGVDAGIAAEVNVAMEAAEAELRAKMAEAIG